VTNIYIQGTAKEISRLPGGVYFRLLENKIQLTILKTNLFGCRGISCKDIFKGLKFIKAVY
jgi:hypothetical protein